MIQDIAEVIDQYKHEAMPKTSAGITAIKVEYPDDWQRERRVEYLKGRMQDIIFKTLYLMQDYDRLTSTEDVDSRLFVGGKIIGAVKTVLKLQDEIIRIRRPRKARKGDITLDNIRQAKEVPCNQLVEVDRNNMARCPLHDDRTPSLRWYRDTNRLYCFSCGRGWDTIGFLMERDNLGFTDAVKSLQ